MKNITIEDIIKVTGGKLLTKGKENILKDVTTDTRKIKESDTFVGIKGEKFNGNELWKKAIELGAKIVIIEGIEITEKDIQKYNDIAIILVEDTIKALGQIAKYKRSLYNIPVIAITGSVGKTSTKDIVANVVSQKYKTLKTEGNFNNHLGVPLTLLKLKDHEAAVIEMGMNHEGEIRYLTNIVKPTISVITNIGTSHIGYLGSRENILKAKMEIVEGMEKKKLIINNDNDLLHKFNKENEEIETITFGIENQSDIMAKDIVLNEQASEFTYKNEKIKVPVGGIHFVYNALCATAVGESLGINKEQIKRGIEDFKLTQKRMEIITLSNGAKIINDSYNASFESMKASLKYLAEQKEKRKIAVLGDMLELGEFSKKLHNDVGKEVTKNNIDLLICIGKEAKYIAEAAKIEIVRYYEDSEEALKFIKSEIRPKDIILFKASNGMKFYNMVEKLINK